MDDVKQVAETLRESGMTVGVGYMLRYCSAVQKMKQILAENDLTVMMTSAKYVMGKALRCRSFGNMRCIEC